MHNSVQNYKDIINLIKLKLEDQNNTKLPKIIAVSKTFHLEKIIPLIHYGHLDFGENKVQEATDKWTQIKLKNPNIKIHLIGKLQTNKVKFAIKIFDYIHSLDSEDQKSGIDKFQVNDFYNYCKKLNLNIIGLMCIPPIDKNPDNYFNEIKILNQKLNLPELSMGMSSDYLKAVENSSTYLRIGSNIFGPRN